MNKINKVDLFRKYLDKLKVNYIDPCTGLSVCHTTITPTSTLVPISGVSCPIIYPVIYNSNSYLSEAALLSAVQLEYPTFSITYDNVLCNFIFVGEDIPPTEIILSLPVASCNPVANLQVTNISTDTASLSWDAPLPTPADYKIEIYSGATLVQTVYTVLTNIDIVGLSATTTYNINVISRCGLNDTDNSIPAITQLTTTAYPLKLTNGYRVRQLFAPTSSPEENLLELGYTNPADHSLPSSIEFDYSACGYPEVATNLATMVDITANATIYPIPTCWYSYQYKNEAYLKFDHYFSGNPSTYYVYNVPLLSATDYASINNCGTTWGIPWIQLITYNFNYLLGIQPTDNTCTLEFGSFVGDLTSTHILEVLDSSNTVVASLIGSCPLTTTTYTINTSSIIFDSIYLEPNGKYQLLNLRFRKIDNSCSVDFKLQIIKSKVFV